MQIHLWEGKDSKWTCWKMETINSLLNSGNQESLFWTHVHLMLFVNAYVVLTVIVSLLKILLQWGFQQPPPASEIHHHKGIECTGLCTEGRTAERNIQSCPTEVWCPPNRCTMPHLHYHWKVKDKTHLCFINKTVLFRVLWSQQTSHKGNCICLYFCCCTAGFWHGSSSDRGGRRPWPSGVPLPQADPKSVTVSLCNQDRYLRKSALCRESFSQLQSGRTYVDWHWPGKQLHRISFEWISLQSDAPGKRFTLRAVIAFRGGLTQDTLGHYVAYCRRSPFVWEMYDDLRSGVTGASDKNKICPHAVLYTKDWVHYLYLIFTSSIILLNFLYATHPCFLSPVRRSRIRIPFYGSLHSSLLFCVVSLV